MSEKTEVAFDIPWDLDAVVPDPCPFRQVWFLVKESRPRSPVNWFLSQPRGWRHPGASMDMVAQRVRTHSSGASLSRMVTAKFLPIRIQRMLKDFVTEQSFTRAC